MCWLDLARMLQHLVARRQLIAEHYPWFLQTYNALPKNIMRADAVRP